MNNIETKSIIERSRKPLLINSLLFLLFFLFWIIRLLFIDGYSVNETTSVISIEPNKYLNNIIQMPLNSIIMIVGILLVLIGIYKAIFKKDENSIWFSGSGTILTVFSIFILSGLNNTAFYPSTFDIQSSLTIQNSSSSKFTLTVMSYVALLIPFVAAYIIYAWRAMDKTKITVNEIDEDSHSY